LTNFIFFDTDCFCSFLWCYREDLLIKLFPKRIILPTEVREEISNAHNRLIRQLEQLLAYKKVKLQDVTFDDDVYQDYLKLSEYEYAKKENNKLIGVGEASCIAFAKNIEGSIVASNISYYVKKFQIKLITTPIILYKAYKENFISREEGDTIWHEMREKRNKLPFDLFSEYLHYEKEEI